MADESQAPAAEGSQAAPSSSAAEGAAAEGGSNLPLIIGGVVVLALLGGVGAFLALSSKPEPGDSSSSVESSSDAAGTPATSEGPPAKAGEPTYFGSFVADFQGGKNGVAGKVYAATEKSIYITGFSFDGKVPDAKFVYGDGPDPKEDDPQINDENNKPDPLKEYKAMNIKLTLPDAIKTGKIIAVFSKTGGNLGSVKVPDTFVVGAQDIDPIAGTGENKATATVTLKDSMTADVKTLKVEGTAPDEVYITAGKGDIKKDTAEKLSEKLSGLDTEKDVVVKAPKSWDQYEWISIFSFAGDGVDLGNTKIPSALTVPVAEAATSRRLRAVKRRGRSGHQIIKAQQSKPKLLTCTFGESGVTTAMIPGDGMCDVMFYTDMQYDNDQDTIVPRDGGPAFNVLKSAARKYSKTTFGTSMSTGSIADAVKDKESELTTALEELFSSRLIHFGMLNVENAEDYDDLKSADLNYLKVVTSFLKKKSSSRRYHCALGISLRDGSKGDKILDVAKRAPRDFPGLTMVIVKLHTDSTGNGDRWPLAPNPDGVDLSEHSALSLALIKDDLKNELTDIARRGRYAMLSFAMYARTYHMKKTWDKAAVREMSESTLNMDYAAVCRMKSEKDVSDDETVYAADEHKKFLALFDSAVTFKTKTKARLSVMPNEYTGLAVYNVEMDDYKDACGKGKFARLKAIKAALGA